MGSSIGSRTLGARLLVTDPGNAPRFERSSAPETLVLEPDTLAAAATDFVCADTAADDPAQLYYTSGTTGLAKGIVPRTATSSATRSSATATR